MAEAQRLAEQGEDEFALVVADCQTAGSGALRPSMVLAAGEGVWMTALFSARPVARARSPFGRWPRRSPLRRRLAIWAFPWASSGPTTCWRRAARSGGASFAAFGRRWPSRAITWLGRARASGSTWVRPRFPEELSGIAASLQELAGAPVSRMACACAVLERLEANYRCLLEDGFSPIRRSWIDHAIGLGEPVRVSDVRRRGERHRLGIDEEGQLLVEVPRRGRSRDPLRRFGVRGVAGAFRQLACQAGEFAVQGAARYAHLLATSDLFPRCSIMSWRMRSAS